MPSGGCTVLQKMKKQSEHGGLYVIRVMWCSCLMSFCLTVCRTVGFVGTWLTSIAEMLIVETLEVLCFEHRWNTVASTYLVEIFYFFAALPCRCFRWTWGEKLRCVLVWVCVCVCLCLCGLWSVVYIYPVGPSQPLNKWPFPSGYHRFLWQSSCTLQ